MDFRNRTAPPQAPTSAAPPQLTVQLGLADGSASYSACVAALQWQRSSTGTPSRALSMCRPHPNQEGLWHLPQLVLWHMLLVEWGEIREEICFEITCRVTLRPTIYQGGAHG